MRERLNTRILRVIEKFISDETRPDKAIRLYEPALKIDPFSENTYFGLMCQHIRSDNHSDAIVVYQRCHQYLTNMLGVEPSPKLSELADAIQSGDETRLENACLH